MEKHHVLIMGCDPAMPNSGRMYSVDELYNITDLQAPPHPTPTQFAQEVAKLATFYPPLPEWLQDLEKNMSDETRQRIERLRNEKYQLPKIRPE